MPHSSPLQAAFYESVALACDAPAAEEGCVPVLGYVVGAEFDLGVPALREYVCSRIESRGLRHVAFAPLPQ